MRRVHDILTGAAGNLLPTTGFDFSEKGAVTPADFMAAGDAIVAEDSRWEWVSDGSSSALDCLNADKQYLCAYDIPCLRIPKLVTSEVGDWKLCELARDAEGPAFAHRTDSEIPSLEPRIVEGDCNDLYDNGTPSRPYRRYDISITYDRYYETPRIWLIGFDAFGLPLSHNEMLNDVPSVYAGRTVTVERHPYTAELNITVHPCYQMEALHRQKSSNAAYRPENAITFALQIWSSVLPMFCLLSQQENCQSQTEA
ncbi:-Autophagy-related protein 3 [Babesia bigemina]|uniref:-Autophagy-related protein 3 n=1 Tax=Babesia bigemina TaxID=5866 RepID=A0A061DA17_BABBI|nr:-Autophagy-related protein 3 [Babesia bigemina]CDR97561.1 -Autophagy-related protein 3 [Babesia bigemina]|eukprot:XP_012769747.1 -Autophagy-related protein 3 [Babesia bigemina]